MRFLQGVLKGAIAAGVLAACTGLAAAQDAKDWPNKAVRMIVNFGPGGSADNSMRPFAERLSKALGQQFVIENRGGASGALGIEAVVKSAPDGYTFVVTPALECCVCAILSNCDSYAINCTGGFIAPSLTAVQ